MNFQQALSLVLAGKRARQSTMATGAFIYLVEGSQFEVNRAPLNKIYKEGTKVSYKPHIDISYGDGSCGVWQITQEAVFAENWEVLETLV